MNVKGIATLVYGVIIVAGGVIGYAAAGSVVSLAAGIVFGGMALAGAVLLLRGNMAGQAVAAIAALVLLFFFGAQLYGAISSGASANRAGAILALTLVELIALFFGRGPAPRERVHGHRAYAEEKDEGRLP